MKTQLIEGQHVTLSSARGPIRRTIVKLLGDVVVVGDAYDYERAKIGVISPFCIGFPVSDVVLDVSVSLKHNVQYEQAEHGGAGPDPSGTCRGE